MGLGPLRLHQLVSSPPLRRTHGARRRPVPRTTARRAHRIMFLRPQRRSWRARGLRKDKPGIEALREKFADDREFTGLKIMLLAGMVMLTALLERAV